MNLSKLSQKKRQEKLALLLNSSGATKQTATAPDYLLQSLDAAIRSRKQIPLELARLEARKEKPTSDEEREYITYQQSLITKQILRAADEAERRLKLIKTLDSPAAREAELDRCRQDTLYWIKNWAWTVDPRSDSPLPTVPFKPFQFQEDTIRWCERLIFEERRDGLIEKTRDIGVSWLMIQLVIKHWLFIPRFDVLLGSRKEDLVDAMGRMDSLFEKIRFQLSMLPEWMLPRGFDRSKHINFLRIVNPELGGSLGGESSNPDFGRAGRYSLVVIDELASFPNGGYEAWTACSQSARTKIVVSTPKGKINKFYELRHNTGIATKTLHWRLHPWKDETWYREQKRTMRPAEIAQELDIDYEASQPGQIFPMWDELRSVITWSQFARVFGDIAKDDEGKPRIPRHWLKAMAQDWGSTDSHKCVTLWATRPSESDPLRNCVFIYRQYIPDSGATPRQVARAIRGLEAPWREHDNMTSRLMSHEAKSERDTYIKEHALPFEAWETDYNAGIAQLQNYMEIRREVPHPFRKNLTGRPRLFLIVDDAEGVEVFEEESGKRHLIDSDKDGGMARLRMEIPRYHYPQSEEGKPVQARRPYKLYDDAMDALRALAAQWFPQAALESEAEKIEKGIPATVRMSAFEQTPVEDLGILWLSREIAIKERKDEDRLRGGTQSSHWRSRYWTEEVE